MENAVNRIYNLDCVEGMERLYKNFGECIDLTVTSPPYDNLRIYNGFSFDFEKVAKKLYKLTKQGGVVVWIVGDATIKGSETGTSFKQALYFKEVGFTLHDTMIYEKITPAPQAQHPRYQPCFEYMFVFCKGYPPKTFNPLMCPTKTAGKIKTTNGQRNIDNSHRHVEKKSMVTKSFKRRTNIWGYPNEKKDELMKKHPATFPEKLAEDHILSWSNENDVILDPFMGSGTTAKMSIKNNRKFIGFEISNEYIEIANKRLSVNL